MEVFRITKKKYADKFFAPGVTGRWNKKGEEVIYTAFSRSLACLENMVHKSGKGGTLSYRTMVIYIPDTLAIEQVSLKDLPENWNQISFCQDCQQKGSEWYTSKKTAVLKVPSAVIPDEFNFVLNVGHTDFKQIKLVDSLPFIFDKRLFDDSKVRTKKIKI